MSGLSIGFYDLTEDQFEKITQFYLSLKKSTTDAIKNAAVGIHERMEQSQPAPGPVATQAEADERDSHNVPWSAQFHSGSRKQTKDGRWALRKGVDKAAAQAYIAQYANVPVQQTAPAQPSVAPAGFASAQPMAAGPSWGLAPQAPYVPDYSGEFVPLCNELANGGILTEEQALEILKACEIASPEVFGEETPIGRAARAKAFVILQQLKGNHAA